MWPAEAFNLARNITDFVYLACFFDKNTLWLLDMSKKKFWPTVRFKLCTPALIHLDALSDIHLSVINKIQEHN